MRSHDIHNDVSAKIGELVCADNWVLGRHKISPRFVFQQAIHADVALDRPFHLRNKANAAEALIPGTASNPGDQFSGPIRIKGSALQMYVGPLKHFELPIFLPSGHIDSRRIQPLNVFVTPRRINDVNGFLARAESILNEWQQHTVVVVVTLEKSTDMAPGAKERSAEPNRLVGLLRIVSFVRRLLHIRSLWRLWQPWVRR